MNALHFEPAAARQTVMPRLQADLEKLAAWLGLSAVKLPKPIKTKRGA